MASKAKNCITRLSFPAQRQQKAQAQCRSCLHEPEDRPGKSWERCKRLRCVLEIDNIKQQQIKVAINCFYFFNFGDFAQNLGNQILSSVFCLVGYMLFCNYNESTRVFCVLPRFKFMHVFEEVSILRKCHSQKFKGFFQVCQKKAAVICRIFQYER